MTPARFRHIENSELGANLSNARCIACQTFPVPSPHVGVWIAMGDEQEQVVLQTVVLGVPAPESGLTRVVWFVLCGGCLKTYADDVDKLNELIKRRLSEAMC